MFSSRSHFEDALNRIARVTMRLRTAGVLLLDLTESNPTAAGFVHDRAILDALSNPASLAYEPAPFGLLAAREAVSGHLASEGSDVDASRIVLTASTSEAYSFAFKLLGDPGDEVLVPQPSYPLFEHLAQLETMRAVPYRLAYDGVWHVDVDSLRAARTARTRALVCVTPNNPTGSYLKRTELRSLATLGLPIVSDEVFASYALRADPTRARSALEATDAPLVLALGGLSKSAALPQMKLAWMALAGDEATIATAMGRLELITDAYLSVGAPVQNAAAALLTSATPLRQTIRARTRENLSWLIAATRDSAASVLDVEGGWYVVVRVPSTQSEEAWTVALAEQDHVLVHPGHFFDFEREAYLVLSLLTPESTFREGATRLLRRVARDA